MAAHTSRTVCLTIRGPLSRADLPGLFERACVLLSCTGVEVLLCDVAGIAADAVAIDALARLALAARRSECHVRLLGASSELRSLAAFVGIAEAIDG
jgi:ABC-type transporter Mla MlaB component